MGLPVQPAGDLLAGGPHLRDRLVRVRQKAAAEFIGTAFLVMAVIGSGIAASRLSPNDAQLAGAIVGAVARTLSDTFAGIAPSSVPAFVLAQLLGGAAGFGLVALLHPGTPRRPPDPNRLRGDHDRIEVLSAGSEPADQGQPRNSSCHGWGGHRHHGRDADPQPRPDACDRAGSALTPGMDTASGPTPLRGSGIHGYA